MILFVVDSILTGVVSLFGFVSSILTFSALRFSQQLANDNEPLASLVLLLQAVTISNIGVLWSIFLMYVVPALGFVIPLLEDCSGASKLIVTLVRPIYLASRAMVAWMTVASLAYSGRMGSTREKSSPRNALKSACPSSACWIIVVSTLIVCAWSVSMIADSWIGLSRNLNNDTMGNGTMSVVTLEQSFWYHLICVEITSVLTVVIPILVGCGILFVQFNRTSYSFTREFVKPLAGLFGFMSLCYVAEITSDMIDMVNQFFLRSTSGTTKDWLIYVAAGSRLCVATYSSLGMLFMLLSQDDFRSSLRDTCHGKTPPPRQEPEWQKSRRMYRCDDATKVTLVSQDDEGSNIRDREGAKDSVYRPHECGYADQETILTEGELMCNV